MPGFGREKTPREAASQFLRWVERAPDYCIYFVVACPHVDRLPEVEILAGKFAAFGLPVNDAEFFARGQFPATGFGNNCLFYFEFFISSLDSPAEMLRRAGLPLHRNIEVQVILHFIRLDPILPSHLVP